MRSWLWLFLVLLCCGLGLATEPLSAPVATLGPATAFPTSLLWNQTADEAESPRSLRFPDGWSFQPLLAPRLPRSSRTPHAASSVFSPAQASELRRSLPEFRQHDAALNSAFSPLRC